MVFIFLVFLTVFLLEGIGTYISIIGLSQVFSSSLIILGLMATLDLAKLVSVSFLYKYWKKAHWFMKSYMLIAVLVTMTITSTGAFSYLSGQFQHAIVGTQQDTIALDSLTEEKDRLQKRKEEIDRQIAQLPADFIRGRTQLQKQFGPEVTRLNTRLAEIDSKLPELKAAALTKQVEVGPILYIAEAFKMTPAEAIKWIILTIIFVFDPLAIALLVAGNFLLLQRAEAKAAEKAEELRKSDEIANALSEAFEKKIVPETAADESALAVTSEYALTKEASAVIDDIYNGPNHLEAETFTAVSVDREGRIKSTDVPEYHTKYDPDYDDTDGPFYDEEMLNEYFETSKPQAAKTETLEEAITEVIETITEKTAEDQPNYFLATADFVEELDEMNAGRAMAVDSILDEHDHKSDEDLHVDLGRAMANDDDETATSAVHRDIITLNDINKQPRFIKSSLEEASSDGDVTINDFALGARKTPLNEAYSDENTPPTVQHR